MLIRHFKDLKEKCIALKEKCIALKESYGRFVKSEHAAMLFHACSFLKCGVDWRAVIIRGNTPPYGSEAAPTSVPVPFCIG